MNATLATPLHVTWYAPFLSGGGYSSEAITYAINLQQTLPPQSFSIVQFAEHAESNVLDGLPLATRTALQSLMRPAHTVVPSISVCHSTPDVWEPDAAWGWGSVAPCPPPNAIYKVGRTMYETDRAPATWVPRLNGMDRIWVPTVFHKNAFAKSGVDPSKLVVLPEAVDVAFFNPSIHKPLASLQLQIQERMKSNSNKIPQQQQIPNYINPIAHMVAMQQQQQLDVLPTLTKTNQKPFIFLSIFKWEDRKNWQGLMRAYFQEFSNTNGNNNVMLILKTSPFHNDRPIEEDITEFAMSLGLLANAPYMVFGKHLALTELPSLYAAADAFVLPSRGEGWGRPHAEAMAMGLPVLATNWSGNTAFMNSTNSMLIPVDKLVERKPGDKEGHRWAEPSVSGLQKLMRHCVSHPLEVAQIGKRGRRTMVEEYSPEVVGRLLRKELKSIELEIDAKRSVGGGGEGGEGPHTEL